MSGNGQGALDLCPAEVWETIFDHLHTSQDLFACSQACHTFRRILHPKRTITLFPQVLDKIQDLLPEATLLTCRLVCHPWKHAIDSLGLTKSRIYHSDITNIVTTSRLPHSHNFYHKHDFFRFFSAMLNLSGANPFPTRSVRFRDCPGWLGEEQEVLQFWLLVHRVLSDFGRHIYTAVFEIGSTADLALDLFDDSVTQSLGLLPNLKTLVIGLSSTNIAHLWTMWEADLPRWQKIREASPISRLPPFPQLTHMYLPVLPKPLMDTLLEATKSTLKHLSITTELFWVEEDVLQDVVILECLESFDSIFYPRTKESLVNFSTSRFAPTLTSLSLQAVVLTEDFDLFVLLKALNSFPNLEELVLGVWGADYAESWRTRSFRLELRKLKRLALNAGSSTRLKSIDFCRKLKALTTLSLTLYTMSEEEGGGKTDWRERLKFTGYASRMYESNVWDVLPVLGELTVKKYYGPEWVYTRDALCKRRAEVEGNASTSTTRKCRIC